jgi:FKBP-type peptidyl-prolyl cis-trans isomerase 2
MSSDIRTAREGDKVKVHYTGRLEDGSEFDTSVGNEPLVFTIGGNEVIPGFEGAALGMKTGEIKSVTVAPESAYGPYNDELVVDMPREYIPEDIVPEIGMMLKIVDNDGNEIPVRITVIEENSITLDANHPLAGKTLVFDIKLLEIM